MARRLAQTTARVVTFMPPAVEPGAPPMNIRPIIRKRVAGASRVRSRVLKPAVRQVADWNKACDSRSHQESPARAPLPSTRRISSGAADQQQPEAVSTTLACRPRRMPGPGGRRRARPRSQPAVWATTPKPSPPSTTSRPDRLHDQRPVRQAHQGVAEGGEAGVAEGADGVEDRGPQALAAVGDHAVEPAVKQRRPGRLDGQGHQDDEAQGAPDLGQHRHLEDLAQEAALAHADAPPQQQAQGRGQGHDAQSAELDQQQDHRLAERREAGPGVPHDQPGDADGAGGGEQGVEHPDGRPRRAWPAAAAAGPRRPGSAARRPARRTPPAAPAGWRSAGAGGAAPPPAPRPGRSGPAPGRPGSGPRPGGDPGRCPQRRGPVRPGPRPPPAAAGPAAGPGASAAAGTGASWPRT